MVSIGFHFGAKTSRYGPHELGYRRATKTKQNDAIPSLFLSFFFFIEILKKKAKDK